MTSHTSRQRTTSAGGDAPAAPAVLGFFKSK